MSKGSIITLLVLVVLVLGGFLGFKEYQKRETSAKASADAKQLLSASKMYQANREYLDGLIDRHHAEAFGISFKRKHLFAPTEFDEQQYLELLWEKVSASAQQENRSEVTAALPAVSKGYGRPF